MKNRIFLVCLVLVLILAQAILRNVETNYLTASPTDMVLGASPDAGMAWSSAALTFSLPFAVFTAAALVAVLGMGADCLSWIYDLRGVSEPADGAYTRLGTCAMWCAWPVMAACTGAVYAAFPNASTGAETLWQSPFFTGLMLAAGIYLVCRLICKRFPGETASCTGIVIFLLATRCLGSICMEEKYMLLPAGLALAYAAQLLLRPAALPRALGAVLALAVAGAVCHFCSQGRFFQTDIPYFGTPCYIYTALVLAVLGGLVWLKWRALPQDAE